MKGFGYAVAFLAGANYVWVMENVRPKEFALLLILVIWIGSMWLYNRIMKWR